MNENTLHARHYATRKPVKVHWKDGRISSLQETPETPPENLWIAPALFDVQVNGYGGIDFQKDNLTEEELLVAARALRRDGCPRFLLTLITDEWSTLTARLRHIRTIRDQSPPLRQAILGWHIEGPFLCELPGYHGAHNPQVMRDPEPAHVRELRDITGHDPLLLTVSPERHGAIDAIRLAVSLGAVVSLGHTGASAEALADAVAAGATGFTHLGNGCPKELDRHDNILWRVFDTPGITASLIPDRIHVPPALFRIFHRVLGSEAIYYTTDCMSAAGAPPGRYKLGTMDIEVGADQIVRQPGRTNLAGSALRPIQGVFRAAEMLGCDWQDAWARFSQKPAQLMRLKNDLAAGGPATFCLLQVDAENQLQTLRVYDHGDVAGAVE